MKDVFEAFRLIEMGGHPGVAGAQTTCGKVGGRWWWPELSLKWHCRAVIKFMQISSALYPDAVTCWPLLMRGK